MVRALSWLGAHGTRILPFSLFLGLAWADLAELVRPALAPAIFLMLALLMTRVDTRAARQHLVAPLFPLLGLAWALLALPVLFALGISLTSSLLSAGLVLALVFWASSPPLFSTAALAYLMRLDGPLSLGFLLAAIALHPILTPYFTATFTDGTISISPVELAWRLALICAGAAVIAVGLRKWLGLKRIYASGDIFDGLNVIALIVFAIGLMDGIGARILADPVYAVIMISFVMFLCLAVNALTAALFWRAGRKMALTLGFSAGGRNIALAIGALAGAVPEDTWFFFAMLQFPIYCLPAILKPVYDRLLPLPGAPSPA